MAKGLDRIEFRMSSLPDLAMEARDLLAAPEPDFPEDFDSVARRYMSAVFEQPTAFITAETDNTAKIEEKMPALQYRGISEIGLTNTITVDYSQNYHGVPIYGAGVGVEMTSSKEFRAINGHVGKPPDLDPVARLSPAAAVGAVKEIAGLKRYQRLENLNAPSLLVRFNEATDRWHLVYVFDNVHIHEKDSAGRAGEPDEHPFLRSTYKVFIDAHNGEEVVRIPLRRTARAVECSGKDARGGKHQFTGSEDGSGWILLEDPGRKIRTMSMEFQDIVCGELQLAGRPVTSQTKVFGNPAAVSAHVAAARVYDFLKGELKRNSIDAKGMWIVSVVDCLDYRYDSQLGMCKPPDPNVREWKNAAWIMNPDETTITEIRNGLMVYGQMKWDDGVLHSYSEGFDVVAHEMTHGITSYSCDLEYVVESGALNESYSDILGVAMSNSHLEDLSNWNWEMGEELSKIGKPIRNMADPGLYGQPAHMREFKRLSIGERPSKFNDWGYVHRNSGVHNKAAYNLFVGGVFSWREILQMFYLTLTKRGVLTTTSGFADSKAGMLSVCESLFADRPDLNQRLAAINAAFAEVGI